MGKYVVMADEKKSAPSEEKLDELEEEIERARRDGEVAEHGSFYEGDHPMYEDSGREAREDDSDTGAESKSDDQNIAPG
jgi:hypothetical protein